jgi:predicted class III extradiol MEMO1 family dioxygenase
MDIKLHKKPYFLDLSINHNYNFGNKNTRAMIVPHAGSEYINQLLTYSFNDINKFSKVLLLTTNHIDNNNYSHSSFPISNTVINNDHFNDEHSYLSILPYIQNFRYIVVSIGLYNEELLLTLLKLIDDSTLIIANTDLLHCGPDYQEDCPDDIDSYNMKIIQDLINYKSNSKICGYNCILVFNKIIKTLGLKYSEYAYSNSNMISQSSNSVGYAAILFNKDGIPDIENNSLLKKIPKLYLKSKLNLKFRLYLRDIVGIFVTIEKNNKLRGCIGLFELYIDIINTITKSTKLSAFYDTRFTPINIGTELKDLIFKINYLKKPFIVDITLLFQTFIVGLHGITVYFSDNKSATYLASVMVDYFYMRNNNDFKTHFDVLVQSLKDKAQSYGYIKYIELYECREYI